MADARTIKTTIELTGEGSYAQKLKEISNALKGVASEQRVVDAQFDAGDKSLAAQTARYDALRDKLELQKRKLEEIRQEYERVVAAEGKDSDHAQRLAREYNNTAAQVAKTEKALDALGDEMDGTAAKTEKLKAATEAQKKALMDVAHQAEQTASKLAKAMGAAITATVTGSVKAFMDFESEMSMVDTLADKTVLSLDELSDQALETSRRTGIEAKEIAASAYGALSAGVDTKNVMSFMESAGKAAKAGKASLDDAIDGATSAMNAWDIAYDKADAVYSKFLIAQDKGKTTLGEMAKQMGQVTGLAPQLGVSLEEVLASVAALTKNGVQTNSAFTGLKAIMSSVLKPTKEAQETAAALGISFDAASLQAKGLTGFLADIEAKTHGDSEALAKLFGNVEGLSKVMLLGGAAAGDYQDALGAMAGSAGRLDEAFATVTDNRAARLNMALNSLKVNAIQFGRSLAPYVDMAAEALGKLSDAISGMNDEQMRAALQTGLMITGALGILGSMSKIAAASKTLMAVFSGPAGWITLGVAGVAALVAGLTQLDLKLPTLERSMDRLFGQVDQELYDRGKRAFDMTLDPNLNLDTENLKTEVTNVYDEIGTALTDGLPDTTEVVAGLEEKVRALYSNAVDQIETWVNEEIAKLDVNSATYDQEVANITAKGEELKTSLQGQESATVAFIHSMAGKSTEYVLQHLGELEEIEAAVQKTIEQLEYAKSLSGEAGEQASKITKSGSARDIETVARGFKYEKVNRDTQIAELEAQYQSDLTELNAKYNELGEVAYEEAATKLSENLEKNKQGVEDTYKASILQMLQGMGQSLEAANPEAAAQIQQAVEKMKLAEELQQVMNEQLNPEDASDTLKNLFAGNFEQTLERAFNPENNPVEKGIAKGWGAMLLQNLTNEIDSATEGADLDYLGTAIQLALDEGVFEGIEGLDMSSSTERFRTMFADVGKNGAAGFGEGLSEGSGDASDASSEMAESAIKSAQAALQENSPSRVFRKIGENAGAGLVQGLLSKRGAVYAAARALAQAAESGARITLEVHSPSRVFERIGSYTAEGLIRGVARQADAVERAMSNLVNPSGIVPAAAMSGEPSRAPAQPSITQYNEIRYSGAFTRSEARRFGRALYAQMAADATARGSRG